MKTKTEILRELKRLAAENNLNGVVVDQLLDILTYYLYEQQASLASIATESSVNTCTLLNSFITHTSGFMFSTERTHPRAVWIADINDTFSGEYSTRKNDVVYSSSKFKLVLVDKKTVNTKSYYKFLIVDNYKTIEPTISPSGGMITLSDNNICQDFIGLSSSQVSSYDDLSAYITDDFNEYYLSSNNVCTQSPKLFQLTKSGNTVELYYNKSVSSSRPSIYPPVLNYCTDYLGEITNEDIYRINIPNLIDSSWSNSNDVVQFYNSNERGTLSNPYEYNWSPDSDSLFSESSALLFTNGFSRDLLSLKNEFDYYMSKQYNLPVYYNVISVFKQYLIDNGVSDVCADLITSMSDAADVSISSGSGATPVNTGIPIYCIIYSNKYANNIPDVAKVFVNDSDYVTIYNDYDWYDDTGHIRDFFIKYEANLLGVTTRLSGGSPVASKYLTNILKVPSYNILVLINDSSSVSDYSKFENDATDLLNYKYSKKLLSGYNVINSINILNDLSDLANDNGLYITGLRLEGNNQQIEGNDHDGFNADDRLILIKSLNLSQSVLEYVSDNSSYTTWKFTEGGIDTYYYTYSRNPKLSNGVYTRIDTPSNTIDSTSQVGAVGGPYINGGVLTSNLEIIPNTESSDIIRCGINYAYINKFIIKVQKSV